MEISVVIPAYNEERLIGSTVEAALAARETLRAQPYRNSRLIGPEHVEILVVDNDSTDSTVEVVESYGHAYPVRALSLKARGAARARNHGAANSLGRVLVFVDADTAIPPEALRRILEHEHEGGYQAGITRLAEAEGGLRARLWWMFWEHVRRLPMARAKAMPAFMFCTREVFEELGPFDERVAIGEEWPILAGLYGKRRHRLVYDRSLTALSSSRRMEQQPFGYLRTFFKYVWAILHFSGRVNYSDRIR